MEQVVARLGARARGEGLGPDEVPGSTFFWQEGGALLGVLGLRHRLNARLRAFGGHIGYSVRPGARRRGLATRMLAEAMTLARARGIAGVLLTCAPDNLASIRVIERSGGVFEAEAYFAPEDRRVRRYWIGPPEPENAVNSAP
ncbi:MAG: GNAT family N-acetyltransferase [Myxococcales bacterium]|nr:GNAT family N-acetyltransferase [Myxococcales bacterium]